MIRTHTTHATAIAALLAAGCTTGSIGPSRVDATELDASKGGAPAQSGSGGRTSSSGGATQQQQTPDSGHPEGASGGTRPASSGGSTARGGATNNGGTTSSGGTSHSGGTSAGGMKGTGGSSGPPPVPVTCTPNLGSVGTWQKISPPPFVNPSNMEALAVTVDPKTGTVYAAAGNKTNGGNGGTGVLKSTDCGGTFTLVNTGRGKDTLQSGDLWALLINKDNPSILYTQNGYGDTPTLYRSTNGGVDFDPLNVDPEHVVQEAVFVQAIGMDPKDSTHLAVTFHENCGGKYRPLCLSQSKDGGDTWQMFNGPSQLGGWNEGASITVVGPDSYIYAGSGVWFTADGGNTWSEPSSNAIIGSYGGGAVLAPDGSLYLGVTNDGIYQSKSTPLGATWKKVAPGPQTSIMAQDGTNLYASYTADYGGKPYYTASLSDPTKWTNMPSGNCNRGANAFGVDPIHHLVYAASWGAGLWRVATQ